MRKFKVNEKKLNLTIQKLPSCLNSDYFCDYFWLIFTFLLALEVQNFTIFHDIFLNFNLLFYSLGIVFLIVFYRCTLVLLAILCSALFGLWKNKGKWQKLVVKNCYVHKFLTITYLAALDWNFLFSRESKLKCYICLRVFYRLALFHYENFQGSTKNS